MRWKGGYELIKDVETSSKEDDESWHNDEEEEDETTVSEHCENMWELNLKTSAKTNIPSWHRYHNEEDSVSLKHFFTSLHHKTRLLDTVLVANLVLS